RRIKPSGAAERSVAITTSATASHGWRLVAQPVLGYQYAREFWGTLLQHLIVKIPRVLDKSFALCLAAFLAYLTFDQAWLQWKFRIPFPRFDMVIIVKLLDAN